MDLEEWLRYGGERGWVSAPVCSTHDGVPTSEAEDDDVWDGGDPCVHVLRLYESELQKRAVEKNHSPAKWRASNRGWKAGGNVT